MDDRQTSDSGRRAGFELGDARFEGGKLGFQCLDPVGERGYPFGGPEVLAESDTLKVIVWEPEDSGQGCQRDGVALLGVTMLDLPQSGDRDSGKLRYPLLRQPEPTHPFVDDSGDRRPVGHAQPPALHPRDYR